MGIFTDLVGYARDKGSQGLQTEDDAVRAVPSTRVAASTDPEVFRLRERLNRLYNGERGDISYMPLEELRNLAQEEGL